MPGLLEQVLPGLQAYGAWVLLGGAFIFLGLTLRREGWRSASCPLPRRGDAANWSRPRPTPRCLRAELAALQARRAQLARALEALERNPPRPPECRGPVAD